MTTKLLLSLGLVTFFVWAQDQPAVKIKRVPIGNTSAASGVEMFKTNCAPCHGLDAKGDGPAAGSLKTAPPDLTLLAKKNGGKFPMIDVSNSIKGDANVGSHGSKEMPVWGELFRSVNSNDTLIQLRVHNLAKYIQSLQEK